MPLLTRIKTPENMEIRFHQAGLASRGAAFIQDLAIQLLICLFPLVMFLAYGSRSFRSSDIFMDLSFGFLVFCAHIGYFMICELLMRGQSIGKRSQGIRVVTRGGQPVGFYHSLLRNLLRIVDFLPLFFFFGVLSILGTERHQRLGDFLAETMVVKDAPNAQEKEF